jgi:hypothetical protein
MAAAANTETALPIALAAYIDAYRDTVGLPSSTALPCRTFIRDADADYPRLFITVNGGIDSPHPRRLSIPITVELQTRMEDTTPTDEDTWLAALHRLLSDADAIRVWMASNAQPFSLRTARLTAISTGIDTEKQIRGRRTDLSIHLRAHELAPLLAVA